MLLRLELDRRLRASGGPTHGLRGLTYALRHLAAEILGAPSPGCSDFDIWAQDAPDREGVDELARPSAPPPRRSYAHSTVENFTLFLWWSFALSRELT